MNLPKRTNFKKIFTAALALTMASVLIVSMEVGYKISHFAAAAAPQKSDAILVLGCGVDHGQPSPFMRARLDQALALYHEGLATKIIVSGGIDTGETLAESDVMKGYLKANGIPPSKILAEDQSKSTEENLVFSAQLMQKNHIKTIIIVSNNFQLRRAHIFAQRLGISETESGVYVSSQKPAEVLYFGREIIASVYYRLF